MKNKEYVVNKDSDLIKYMRDKGYSKNKIKSLVKYECIYVNDVLIKRLPFNLSSGDKLVIGSGSVWNSSLNIVYEDDNYLVVNKEAGLLTISTSSFNKKYEDTLYRRVRSYLNSKKEYAFIVNRIDKETSGLVIFAKSEKFKDMLQNNWNSIVLDRKYIAVVSGKINKNGRIDNYLYEDKMTFSHSTNYGGKRAITNYKVIANNDKYTLLDINILTGRKNQIRVHMTEMGHPIVGDKKYYSKDNSMKRLMLHHYEIALVDPITKKLRRFRCDIPKEFYYLFNNN